MLWVNLVVLGLAEEIHGHPVGGVLPSARTRILAGAMIMSHADGAEHAALGGGHVGAAGPADLKMTAVNGGRAIGQRGHGLRAITDREGA